MKNMDEMASDILSNDGYVDISDAEMAKDLTVSDVFTDAQWVDAGVYNTTTLKTFTEPLKNSKGVALTTKDGKPIVVKGYLIDKVNPVTKEPIGAFKLAMGVFHRSFPLYTKEGNRVRKDGNFAFAYSDGEVCDEFRKIFGAEATAEKVKKFTDYLRAAKYIKVSLISVLSKATGETVVTEKNCPNITKIVLK